MPDHDSYVQGGAMFVDDRGMESHVKTKKLLKEILKDDPSSITLYDTSAFTSKFQGSADSLPPGVCFNVVGPDPYTKRNWYASVYKNASGALVCT